MLAAILLQDGYNNLSLHVLTKVNHVVIFLLFR